MPYSSRNFHVVVLVQYTHSTGRKSRVGTNMEPRLNFRTLWIVIAAGTCSYKSIFYVRFYSVLRLSLKTCCLLNQRGTQKWNSNKGLPRKIYRATSRDKGLWLIEMGSRGVMECKNPVILFSSLSHEWIDTEITYELVRNSQEKCIRTGILEQFTRLK